MGFYAGFNECKGIVLPHLPDGATESLHTNRSDVNLQSVIRVCISEFSNMSDLAIKGDEIDFDM